MCLAVTVMCPQLVGCGWYTDVYHIMAIYKKGNL